MKKESIPSQNLPLRSLDKQLSSPEKNRLRLRKQRAYRREAEAEKKCREAEEEQRRIQLQREEQEQEFDALLDAVNAEITANQISELEVAELLVSLSKDKKL